MTKFTEKTYRFFLKKNIRTVELTSNNKVIPSNVMFYNDKLY